MARTVSAAKAKAQFAECIRQAENGNDVFITRHGRTVAALVAADRVKQLDRLRAAGPAAGLAGLAGGWPGSEELRAQLKRVRRSPPRRVRSRSR